MPGTARLGSRCTCEPCLACGMGAAENAATRAGTPKHTEQTVPSAALCAREQPEQLPERHVERGPPSCASPDAHQLPRRGRSRMADLESHRSEGSDHAALFRDRMWILDSHFAGEPFRTGLRGAKGSRSNHGVHGVERRPLYLPIVSHRHGAHNGDDARLVRARCHCRMHLCLHPGPGNVDGELESVTRALSTARSDRSYDNPTIASSPAAAPARIITRIIYR